MKKKDKFVPLANKDYIVTDQCAWSQMTEEEQRTYNPYDKKRAPHMVQLIDSETGTIVNLLSGSIVRVVESRAV